MYYTALLGGEAWFGFLQGQVSVRNVPFITDSELLLPQTSCKDQDLSNLDLIKLMIMFP